MQQSPPLLDLVSEFRCERLFVPKMIQQAADTHKDETLDDADDAKAHHDPFGNLGEEASFDDVAASEADDGDDDCKDDSRPNHQFLDKFFLFHIIVIKG